MLTGERFNVERCCCVLMLSVYRLCPQLRRHGYGEAVVLVHPGVPVLSGCSRLSAELRG